MTNQRRWLNYLRTAGLSKGYYLHLLAGGLALLGLLGVFASALVHEVSLVLLTIPDAELAATAQNRLLTISLLFFACFLGFVLCTVAYVALLSHRVGGPIVAIRQVIGELKKGNYDVRRKLRQNDELIPIMTELHELGQSLKSKNISV